MARNTITRQMGRSLLLGPAFDVMRRMLADMLAIKAKEEPSPPTGMKSGGHGRGYAVNRPSKASQTYQAHWNRWYKAEQKAQRQFSAIKHHRYRFERRSLSLEDVA